VVPVPGDHLTIMQTPYVNTIAERVDQSLQAAEKETPAPDLTVVARLK
jgi:thioesterase domain-containing protein